MFGNIVSGPNGTVKLTCTNLVESWTGVPALASDGVIFAPDLSPAPMAAFLIPTGRCMRISARCSSEIDSQHRASLKRRTGQPQLRTRNGLACLIRSMPPCDVGGSVAASQHLAPSVFQEPVYSLQCAAVPGNAIVGVLAP